jgi:3-hydroxybutyryl-CoA dehydrogenase
MDERGTEWLPAWVAVIGTGIMGSGIAQVFAVSGLQVAVYDASMDQVERALSTMQANLARRVSTGRLDAAAAEEALARVRRCTDLGDAVAEADFVIEAIIEQLPAKQALFGELDRRCAPTTILATNTSQFSISAIASSTQRPDRVVGMHFFNPPPVMQLVELVRGQHTSDETLGVVRRLAARCGKEVVHSADSQGFITSRLIAIVILEAMRIVQEGVADVADVDRACRLAFNWPMGPIELADFVGLDTLEYSADALANAFGERFLPPQNLRRHVAAGLLGRKSGEGFGGRTADRHPAGRAGAGV